MEASINLATKHRILPEPSRLRPAAEDSDETITLTREEASRHAQNEVARAKAEERKITEAAGGVVEILREAGIQVNMPHFNHRLKSQASMTDQLTGMSVPIGSVPQLISNAVRHVFAIPDKDFTRAFKAAILAFEEQGYTEHQTTNWFRYGSPTYIGIHTVLATAEGYRFQVEFHTPASYRAKVDDHDTYKKLQKLKQEPGRDALEEAEKLEQKVRESCRAVAIPDNVLSIAHWRAEGDHRGGAAAASGLRAVGQPRMPEIARSAEAREIVAALGERPIVLVGMPGAGKSSIGPALAKRLRLPFIDTDKVIENKAGKKIIEIINGNGEPWFRGFEEDEILQLLERGPVVLATGGGAFISEKIRDRVREKGISIWLDTDLDIITKRLAKDTTRPLLQGPNRNQKITELMRERKPFYEQADLRVVPTHKRDNKNADPCVSALHTYLCPVVAGAQSPSKRLSSQVILPSTNVIQMAQAGLSPVARPPVSSYAQEPYTRSEAPIGALDASASSHDRAPARADASLPEFVVGPLRYTLEPFLEQFKADVGHASGQGLNCLLDTVLQFVHNARRQNHETPQTRQQTLQLQQQVGSLRTNLVEVGAVDPQGEIDLYGAEGVGVLLATNFNVRIQAIEADANGTLTVHPVLGQQGPLVHILHTPGHFQPLWPRSCAAIGDPEPATIRHASYDCREARDRDPRQAR